METKGTIGPKNDPRLVGARKVTDQKTKKQNNEQKIISQVQN